MQKEKNIDDLYLAVFHPHLLASEKSLNLKTLYSMSFFSYKKFQRIKKQTEQYRKIKVLSLADYQLEVSPEFLAQMKNQ